MIKVNLLKNVGGLSKSAEVGGAVSGPETGVSGSLDKSAQTMVAIKILVILLFPIALIVYEKMELNDIEAKVLQVTQKIEALKAERSKFGDAAPKIEKYNKEKQRIDKELEIVRGIARNRLREVKSLDALQSLMPKKTWAKKITFKAGHVDLEGYSEGDDGVTDLIRSLESNPIFSKVEVKYTTSEATGGSASGANASIKKFELQFRIGKQD